MRFSKNWNNLFKIQNRVDGVTKSHPDGFLMKQLLHIKQNASISHSKPQNRFRWNFSKRTAGEIRDWAVEQNWAVQIRSHQGHLWLKITSTASKAFFKNRRHPIIQVRPSIPPSNYHPPGGAHLGRANAPRRQLRVPDAPKIKHDKMKQFYMIDMDRKMW